jgi:hypothetical protein
MKIKINNISNSIKDTKVSPSYIMRKRKVDFKTAEKICLAIWRENHQRAKELKKEFLNNEFKTKE